MLKYLERDSERACFVPTGIIVKASLVESFCIKISVMTFCCDKIILYNRSYAETFALDQPFQIETDIKKQNFSKFEK